MRPILDPQVKALIEAGFMRPVDVLCFIGWLSLVGNGVYHIVNDDLTLQRFFVLALGQAWFISIWLLVIAYRVLFHIIMTRSDINTLPDTAARLAISYQLRR